MQAKTADNLENPVELNDVWVGDHKDHSLCWMIRYWTKKLIQAQDSKNAFVILVESEQGNY